MVTCFIVVGLISTSEEMLLRTYLILLVGLIVESFGNVMLRKGMKQIGEIESFKIIELLKVVGRGATNIYVLSGVALDAMFFGCLLIALSWAEVTVVLPLTAFGYVLTALVAKIILGEQSTSLRWAGTILIVVGCVLVGKSGAH